METAMISHAEGAAAHGSGLTGELFGISWETYFPHKLGDTNVKAVHCSFSEALDFLKLHYNRINGIDPSTSAFFNNESNEQRRRFYERCGDFFLFVDGSKTVGSFCGNPIDWSSYYLRNVAILPEYQGFGLFQSFMSYYISVLAKHGINRVETEVAPSNLINVHVFNKLQFNVSGYANTDRWGTFIQFTKYLNPDCEAVFLDRFCSGIKPQARTPGGSAS